MQERAIFQERFGDIWETAAELGLPVVVPVNTVGVMGAGVAKQAVQRYPQLLKQYRALLPALRQGRSVYLPQFQVVLFPTKRHWSDRADLELIASAARSMPCTAAIFPRVGAGLGRLNWSEVKSVLERELPAHGTWVLVTRSNSQATNEASLPEHTR